MRGRRAPQSEGACRVARVSIVVNNYNYGRFLERAIDSALAQDYPDLEVLVVDDGSTDNSRDLIASFGDRIIPVLKSNGGQGSAFNAGFDASSGDIVMFLDADDELHPNCASEVVRAMRPGVSKVHFNLLCVDEVGQPIGPYVKEPLPDGDQAEELATHGLIVSMPTSGNAFARGYLRKVLPMPAEKWRVSADVYLHSLSAFAGRTAALQTPLGLYRVHGLNQSGMLDGRRVNVAAIQRILEREIETDITLSRFAPQFGVNYATGALTRSLGHLQQLFFLKKVAPKIGTAQGSLFSIFWRYIGSLASSRVRANKKILIGAWSAGILLAPRPLAEYLMFIAYEQGAAFTTTRVVISGSGAARRRSRTATAGAHRPR